MTNPFHYTREDDSEYHASLSELKAMVPGLTDPELNALCAALCGGKWVKYSNKTSCTGWFKPILTVHYYEGRRCWTWSPLGTNYTSDWREAGRLLEKYKLDLMWLEDYEDYGDIWAAIPSASRTSFNTNPCCAIAKAAVMAGLTEMIEGGGE